LAINDLIGINLFARVHVGQEFLFDPEDEALGFTPKKKASKLSYPWTSPASGAFLITQMAGLVAPVYVRNEREV
jgi:hypothetical protein